MCCVHFTLCCRETMLYCMLGTDLTSEPSHFGNVQFSSQIASHSPSLARPISNNTPGLSNEMLRLYSPGSLLSWFKYVKGTTRGEYILTESSDDFRPIFIGNPIFWIQETDNSNGVPILCQIAFRHFRFRFLSGWSCFNGLVRNLHLECAWRKSYHSIKRIINPAFLSQCGHGWPRRSSSGSNLVSS